MLPDTVRLGTSFLIYETGEARYLNTMTVDKLAFTRRLVWLRDANADVLLS